MAFHLAFPYSHNRSIVFAAGLKFIVIGVMPEHEKPVAKKPPVVIGF
jgi:hypothetical protein